MFEPVADLDGKRQATARLAAHIRKESFTKTFAALARGGGAGREDDPHIFDDFVAEFEAKVRFRTPRILGIDELKIIGQYRAMITNVERIRYSISGPVVRRRSWSSPLPTPILNPSTDWPRT